ncbi:gas vesicle synthesis-like protein [Streptomyces sp. NPDC056528]|uniref:gas vesicle synthesis-like protein n=1 Tax=Streptomyces sp. NPDC056528 TaxID=3345854 RepID=UPI00369587A4
MALDHGPVTDAFARVPPACIEIPKTGTRVVVTGDDTRLRFVAAGHRLGPESGPRKNPDPVGQVTGPDARGTTEDGAAQTVSDFLSEPRDEEPEEEKSSSSGSRRRTSTRREDKE